MSEFFADDYDDDYGDDDWIYMEDYYDDADELAEHTCPSPIPYTPPPTDYDHYDYWQDLEYLSDGGYFDDAEAPPLGRRKRRRTDTYEHSRTGKRQKGSELKSLNARPTVIWKSQREKDSEVLAAAPLARKRDLNTFALLEDWEKRFHNAPGLGSFTPSEYQTRERQEMAGEGFDLSDLQSVAELLTEENVDTLQQILQAKGLDPEAVQAVLQDLIEGREPNLEDFEDDAEDEFAAEIEDKKSGDAIAPPQEPGLLTTEAPHAKTIPGSMQRESSASTSPITKTQPPHVRSKRKEYSDQDIDEVQEPMTRRNKRRKRSLDDPEASTPSSAHYQEAELSAVDHQVVSKADAPNITTRQTRSGRGKRR